MSFDDPDQDHRLQPILEQLEEDGQFDVGQMRLIKNALQSLDLHSVNFEFASLLACGQRIGSFVIDETLGRGGEGHVYRGHDLSGRPAAIKILHNMRVSDRFRREMHLARQLAHPHIVTAYEVGEFRGLPFITMELLKGPDLHVLVRDSGPLDWKTSTQFILQAARALAHAHRRDLIHRDVKPGNLILHGERTIKLVDLGLAAMSTSYGGMDSVFRFETQDGHMAGTLPFMAPEQARSLANATEQSDIYGLGATWFYLLTGRERLRGKSFSEQVANLIHFGKFSKLKNGQLPDSLESVYERMVAYKPADRYESCDELADELKAALVEAGETVAVVDGINVLVVEDSRTDMMRTIEMLRRTNSSLSIETARTLEDGLQICREMPIDLVLLDLTLPDSMGVGTVTRFREEFEHIPLVVLSGMSQEEAGADCLEAGADNYISKAGLSTHRMERAIFVTFSRCGLKVGTNASKN
jgi:serine/threonine protein kinase